MAGTASRSLGCAVAAALDQQLAPGEVQWFPDGELRPTVGDVRGDDVFVVQSTGPPVNENIVELLLLLDACRRAGAQRITAVVPYFGYARQDRRSNPGDAIGARVVADALVSAGADRLVVVDPHCAQLEAMCSVPVETLTAVPVIAGALRPLAGETCVVVAPDLGAVKLAERYAKHLCAPVAVVRKTRVSGEAVRASELVGDVRSRQAVIIDDMISTGATIEAAQGVLAAGGALPDVVVAATHGVLVEGAAQRISALGVKRLVVTDTLSVSGGGLLQVCTVAPLLAEAIGRLREDRSPDELPTAELPG